MDTLKYYVARNENGALYFHVGDEPSHSLDNSVDFLLSFDECVEIDSNDFPDVKKGEFRQVVLSLRDEGGS